MLVPRSVGFRAQSPVWILCLESLGSGVGGLMAKGLGLNAIWG